MTLNRRPSWQDNILNEFSLIGIFYRIKTFDHRKSSSQEDFHLKRSHEDLLLFSSQNHREIFQRKSKISNRYWDLMKIFSKDILEISFFRRSSMKISFVSSKRFDEISSISLWAKNRFFIWNFYFCFVNSNFLWKNVF